MPDHAAVSGVSDIRTLKSLRSTCVIEAFNLHAAVHYQHNDSMSLYTFTDCVCFFLCCIQHLQRIMRVDLSPRLGGRHS